MKQKLKTYRKIIPDFVDPGTGEVNTIELEGEFFDPSKYLQSTEIYALVADVLSTLQGRIDIVDIELKRNQDQIDSLVERIKTLEDEMLTKQNKLTGVDDIIKVNELPDDPDPRVMYLTPENP